ncbi:putative AraC family transcriptional regulator [Magnetofaba australis IT-1]|uniref:Putative AraC family transcriptional regulator n=1 Tax=Magnetofaba australis IT-1 TaxID=1434232 RepID=A0A1Y2K1Q1_9PROT|nr:putative AraC family transcriptional regulator [Magnetofaba australis IT-1]
MHELAQRHMDSDPKRGPLGGLGVFHACNWQELRAVPIHDPLMILIIHGQKDYRHVRHAAMAGPGELLLLPGGVDLWLRNLPGDDGGDFFSVALPFPATTVAQFRQLYAERIPQWDAEPVWQIPAEERLIEAVWQWMIHCREHHIDPLVAQHRQLEFLLILARSGLAGAILRNKQPNWRALVAGLIAADPAQEWRMEAVCMRLGVSESALRRHLQAEGSGFRTLLEDARLLAGLSLLQETYWPINQVALAVGYQSPSRFSSRFKARFGVGPAELRKTRTRV